MWPRCLLPGLLSAVLPWAVFAGPDPEPLPSPLSLQQALRLAEDAHPDQELAAAGLDLAMAERAGAEADDDLELAFTGVVSAVDPSANAADQSANDSWAKLALRKRLYDFGRTRYTIAAAEARQERRDWHLLDVRQQLQLDVMARFYAVLLADLEYARDNEAMSIAFVKLDRANHRSELGQVSDIELLELDNRFQQTRLQVQGSQNKQRITRSLLAVSLNRPNDLPADLQRPDVGPGFQADDLEPLTQQVLSGNPGLRALRAEVASVDQALRAAESEDNPVIRGELAMANYNRDLGGRNPMTASLILELPLYTGNRVDAKKAVQRARLREQQARLASLELELRQQVLEDWLELQRLQIRRQELTVADDFRDLYLERSRALYDLEISTDLGDSMVQIADLHLQQAENEFQIQLVSARLKALSGRLLIEDKKDN
ncbi:MAG: TolC family protein [Gammaproteobacteria bacterium]|nr:TolC family protein [Gammaproteobacteria bacterium]